MTRRTRAAIWLVAGAVCLVSGVSGRNPSTGPASGSSLHRSASTHQTDRVDGRLDAAQVAPRVTGHQEPIRLLALAWIVLGSALAAIATWSTRTDPVRSEHHRAALRHGRFDRGPPSLTLS